MQLNCRRIFDIFHFRSPRSSVPDCPIPRFKENTFGGTTVSKYDYTVNPMGRRSNLAQTGTAYGGGASLAWGYNPRGEMTLHDHSTAAYDRVYAFDGTGNRTKRATGTTLPASNDTVSNSLNQYTTFPGASASLTYDLDGNPANDGGANSKCKISWILLKNAFSEFSDGCDTSSTATDY